MHPGMALDALGKLIIDQNAQKRDLMAPTQLLTFATAPAGAQRPELALASAQSGEITPRLQLAHNGDSFDAVLTPHALRQLTTWAGIPAKYVDRMTNDRDRALLEENVQHWLRELGEKRMLRMFASPDGTAIVRAFLSDRYRPLDNYDLAEHLMPKIRAAGVEVKSCALTETRLYLQVVSTSLQRVLRPGTHERVNPDLDVLHPGCVISNSEVGAGSLSVEPMVYRVRCTNGLIAGTSLRRNHVGRGFGGDDAEVQQYFSDETRKLDDAAFWAKVSDTVDAAFDAARFHALVDRFEAAKDVELPKNPGLIVDVTQQKLGLNERERDLVMEHLFGAGDNSLFGLANAVTRSAQDVDSYDRAVELERAGGDMLDWKAADFVDRTRPSAN